MLNPKRNAHSPYSEAVPSNKLSGLPSRCDVRTIQSSPSDTPPAQRKIPAQLMQKHSGRCVLKPVRDVQSEPPWTLSGGGLEETGTNTEHSDRGWCAAAVGSMRKYIAETWSKSMNLKCKFIFVSSMWSWQVWIELWAVMWLCWWGPLWPIDRPVPVPPRKDRTEMWKR